VALPTAKYRTHNGSGKRQEERPGQSSEKCSKGKDYAKQSISTRHLQLYLLGQLPLWKAARDKRELTSPPQLTGPVTQEARWEGEDQDKGSGTGIT